MPSLPVYSSVPLLCRKRKTAVHADASQRDRSSSNDGHAAEAFGEFPLSADHLPPKVPAYYSMGHIPGGSRDPGTAESRHSLHTYGVPPLQFAAFWRSVCGNDGGQHMPQGLPLYGSQPGSGQDTANSRYSGGSASRQLPVGYNHAAGAWQQPDGFRRGRGA